MRGKYQVVLLALLAFGLLIAPLYGTSRNQRRDRNAAGRLFGQSTCTTPAFNDIGDPWILTFLRRSGLDHQLRHCDRLRRQFRYTAAKPSGSEFAGCSTAGGGTGANALTINLTMTGLTAQQVVAVMNGIGVTDNSTGLVTVTSQAFISTCQRCLAFCMTGCSSLHQLAFR